MKWILLIILVASSNAFAEFGGCEEHYSLSANTKDGKEVKLVVPGSKIYGAGAWSPENGEPPLTMTRAMELTQSWASENLTRYDGISIGEVTLRKYGCFSQGNDKEYWFYVVDYQPVIEGNKLWGGGNWLAVLMSGEVIEPVRE